MAALNAGIPSPVDAAIATVGSPSRFRAALNAGHASAAARQVDLVERDERRLLEQRGIVGRELVADDLEVPVRIAAGAVDDLHQHPRPLDVAQERVPEARPGAGALDQAGHVRDGRASVVRVDPALARTGP